MHKCFLERCSRSTLHQENVFEPCTQYVPGARVQAGAHEAKQSALMLRFKSAVAQRVPYVSLDVRLNCFVSAGS